MLITYGTIVRMLPVRTSHNDFERSMPRKRRPVGGFWQFLADVAAEPQMSVKSRLKVPSVGTFDWIDRNTWNSEMKIGNCISRGRQPASGLILFSW